METSLDNKNSSSMTMQMSIYNKSIELFPTIANQFVIKSLRESLWTQIPICWNYNPEFLPQPRQWVWKTKVMSTVQFINSRVSKCTIKINKSKWKLCKTNAINIFCVMASFFSSLNFVTVKTKAVCVWKLMCRSQHITGGAGSVLSLCGFQGLNSGS